MYIRYDDEVDALYIRLIEGNHQCRTLRLTEEISLNLAADETLIGIEVLDAKRIIGKGNIPQIALHNLPLALKPEKFNLDLPE